MDRKGIVNLGNNYLNSVLQDLLSGKNISEGLSGLQHNHKTCATSSTGLKNIHFCYYNDAMVSACSNAKSCTLILRVIIAINVMLKLDLHL